MLPPEVEALAFGSYTLAVEPVGSTLAALAAREAGRRVISIDPNLRPMVVGDMVRWAEAAERFYRVATIVKASDEDVRIAWDGQRSIQEAAAYWIGLGAGLVVITEGSGGATAFCRAGQVSAPGHAVQVVDTVGAGDAFVGAFAAAIDSGGDLARGLAYGSVAGALACLTPGAQPSLPTKAAIDARLRDLPPIRVR